MKSPYLIGKHLEYILNLVHTVNRLKDKTFQSNSQTIIIPLSFRGDLTSS